MGDPAVRVRWQDGPGPLVSLLFKRGQQSVCGKVLLVPGQEGLRPAFLHDPGDHLQGRLAVDYPVQHLEGLDEVSGQINVGQVGERRAGMRGGKLGNGTGAHRFFDPLEEPATFHRGSLSTIAGKTWSPGAGKSRLWVHPLAWKGRR